MDKSVSEPKIPIALTRHERIIRGDANRKAREELRNAVRFCMSENGVSPSQVNAAAKEMAQQATAAAMKALTKSATFEAMVAKVVREEMNRAVGTGTTVASLVQREIVGAAQKCAKEFIDKNIIINQTKDAW